MSIITSVGSLLSQARAKRSGMRFLLSRMSGSGKWFSSHWRKPSLDFSTISPRRRAAPSQMRELSGCRPHPCR